MTFHNFTAIDAMADSGANFAPVVTRAGTNFPVKALRYADGVSEYNVFFFRANLYSGTNVDVSVDWYAPSASGAVAWQAELAAITPNTDPGSFEAKAFGTPVQGVAGALGGSTLRLRRTTMTLSDSGSKNNLSAEDFCALKITRLGASGADNLAGDVLVPLVSVNY